MYIIYARQWEDSFWEYQKNARGSRRCKLFEKQRRCMRPPCAKRMKGSQHLPHSGTLLRAAHQSQWETFEPLPSIVADAEQGRSPRRNRLACQQRRHAGHCTPCTFHGSVLSQKGENRLQYGRTSDNLCCSVASSVSGVALAEPCQSCSMRKSKFDHGFACSYPCRISSSVSFALNHPFDVTDVDIVAQSTRFCRPVHPCILQQKSKGLRCLLDGSSHEGVSHRRAVGRSTSFKVACNWKDMLSQFRPMLILE
jgi:hypothetical protein